MKKKTPENTKKIDKTIDIIELELEKSVIVKIMIGKKNKQKIALKKRILRSFS